MDEQKINQVLTELLEGIANKAKEDAKNGTSHFGEIFSNSGPNLIPIDQEAIQEAIKNINKATSTKEGARRLVSALMIAAKAISKFV